MDYTKDKCPVCRELFKEDDDIVVCPVCGTPHHRECYNEVKHCYFEEHHEEGFDYSKLHMANLNMIKNAYDSEAINIMPNKERIAECCKNDPKIDNITKQFLMLASTLTEDNVVLDGIPAVYYREALKKKGGYYLGRFLFFENDMKRRFYFNYSSFLIPFTWCVYRKIYKAAALILALYALIFSATIMPLFTNDCEVLNAYNAVIQNEGAEGLENIINYSVGYSDSLTSYESELFDAVENNSIPKAVNVILILVRVGLRIFFGMYGNKLYFMKLKKLAKSAVDKFDYTTEKKEAIAFMRKKGGTTNMVIVVLAFLIELYFIF